MKTEPGLKFKIAEHDWEFEAIHRLNYKTFVEEIPQHARNADERLIDKFHAENTYAIALEGERLDTRSELLEAFRRPLDERPVVKAGMDDLARHRMCERDV